MNYIKLNITDVDDKAYEVDCNIENPNLVINDEFINKICKKYQIPQIKNLLLNLGVNNMALIIKDYTLTDTVYIEEFYNIKSYISILQIQDVNIHITGQTIQYFKADSSSIFLGDCNVDNADIGIFKENPDKIVYSVDKLELRNVTIGKLKLYAECKNIEIQSSNINELNNNGNMYRDVISTISNFHIWGNSSIGKLSIMNKIEKLTIEDSSITRLLALAKVSIDTLKVEDSIIENCYGFKKEHFNSPTYESWQWIGKSADNARNSHGRAEANYQMAKALYPTETKGDKLASHLFDFCAGYGYKPLRVIRASGVVVFLNTVILTIIKIISILSVKAIPLNITSICKGIKVIWKNFLISLAMLAGQSSVSMENWLSYWLSIIEYLIGVILFAMFVNALYARYKE